MAETQVISALRSKRAELAGVLAKLERQIAGHRAGLAHLDATILLFDPEAKPSEIKPKAPRQRNAWFGHGECARAVYDALRGAAEPMTTRQIADRVMADRGISAEDRNVELVGKMVFRPLGRLQGLERMVVGGAIVWRVA
jgi:hypothetical protein